VTQQYQTEQEKFWAGAFGDEYISRNQGEEMIAGNLALFSKILSRTDGVGSVIEFGSNIGLNLMAIRQLLPKADLSAIEINPTAAQALKRIGGVTVYHQSILDFIPDRPRDFVFIMGVLIHINPDFLPQVYELLYRATGKYLLVCEYYNPTPVQIPYRGHGDRLFKRDFCGEILDKYPDLRLLDYGFAYHRDPNFPQDDVTWFLMEKR
jgi:spore coat polysaccharide biosynthesis protein SpsF